jgi:hypothetical protein
MALSKGRGGEHCQLLVCRGWQAGVCGCWGRGAAGRERLESSLCIFQFLAFQLPDFSLWLKLLSPVQSESRYFHLPQENAAFIWVVNLPLILLEMGLMGQTYTSCPDLAPRLRLWEWNLFPLLSSTQGSLPQEILVDVRALTLKADFLSLGLPTQI